MLRSLLPLLWMATAMDNGNNDDRVFFNSKVDSEWKPIDYGTAGAFVNDRTDIRIFRDSFARDENLIEKFAT